jgi:hypothetical protein
MAIVAQGKSQWCCTAMKIFAAWQSFKRKLVRPDKEVAQFASGVMLRSSVQ